MEFITLFLTIGLIHLLAVASPGPDFFMVLRNTISYSRSVGIYTAIGISLGILVHVSYSLIGIGFIISQSIILFTILKWIGAAYLIYIGWKSLTAKKTQYDIADGNKNISKTKALRIGFFTNVFNPKATLYFLSLFSVIISPETPLFIQALLGAETFILTFVWFTFLATVLSHSLVLKMFKRIQLYFERTMGVLLIGLGIKIGLSK